MGGRREPAVPVPLVRSGVSPRPGLHHPTSLSSASGLISQKHLTASVGACSLRGGGRANSKLRSKTVKNMQAKERQMRNGQETSTQDQETQSVTDQPRNLLDKSPDIQYQRWSRVFEPGCS